MRWTNFASFTLVSLISLSAFFFVLMTGLLKLSTLIIPFNCVAVEEEYNTKRLATVLGADEEIVKEVINVAREEGIDPLLFLALIYTESSFNPNAVSSKGYHGLAQVKWKVPWKDVNLIMGARILKEKYKIANGDLATAILYYKGYQKHSRRGHQQVSKVLEIWKVLQKVALLDRASRGV